MARGIIVSKPTGGTTMGRLMVTDPSAGTDASGGTSTTTTGADGTTTTTTTTTTTAPLAVGSAVSFMQSTTANLGDIVDFSVSADGSATAITVYKAGNYITGEPRGNVTVNAGDSVLIAAHIGGKIIVNGGMLTIMNKSHIENNIESATDNSFVFISGTHVEGKISVTGASYLGVQTSVIEKDIISDRNIFAGVMNNTIKGSLTVTNAATCKCAGNTVSGRTNTPGCSA